jgi:hypothetical protein
MKVDLGNMFTARTADHRKDRPWFRALGLAVFIAADTGLILALTFLAYTQIL